jgi:alanyl-tRNA synthetase
VIVEGYDVEACGGIHVDNTSKVGFIKMLSSERIQDGVVRLEFKSLQQAVGEVQRHETILREVSDLWGVGYDDIPKTAQRFFNEWKELSKRNKELQAEFVAKLLESALKSPESYIELQLPVTDFGTLMKAAQSRKKEFKGKTVILKGDNFAFGYSDTLDVRQKLGEQFLNVEGSEHEARAFKAKSKAQ